MSSSSGKKIIINEAVMVTGQTQLQQQWKFVSVDPVNITEFKLL